jgi:hypothetical protein
MADVIYIDEIAQHMVAIDQQHRAAMWTMFDNGAPITDIPPLQFSFRAVPRGAVNAIPRTSKTEATETIEETEVPVIKSITTRSNTAQQEGTNTSTEDAKDTDESTQISADSGNETATESGTTTATDTTNQTTNQTQTHGTTDRSTSEVEI